ncbi:hypothetical protein Acr_24g0008300 [Actinidia rufa]|uniref:Uncharacterized protein n=1 Tax=Actinidia rufa TaxID=165716 RepID=A0A7J0GUW9_9ERIC|nr:hypothetical protein Acr_24g0008300 [Actinidia rufa]
MIRQLVVIRDKVVMGEGSSQATLDRLHQWRWPSSANVCRFAYSILSIFCYRVKKIVTTVATAILLVGSASVLKAILSFIKGLA